MYVVSIHLLYVTYGSSEDIFKIMHFLIAHNKHC